MRSPRDTFTLSNDTGPKRPNVRSPWTIFILTALAILAIPVAVMVWFSGLGALAGIESMFRGAFAFWMILAASLIIGTVPFGRWVTERLDLDWVDVKSPSALDKVRAVLGVFILVGGIAYLMFGHGYLAAKTYAADVSSVDEVVDFADRAPWNVADSYAQRDQGDIIGEREDVHFVPAAQDAKAADGEGTSRYTTLVRGRAPLGATGYEAIQTLNMPATGTIPSSASGYCEIPDHMNKKLTAFWPGNSLSWAIHAKSPFAHWSGDDAYGYCQGDDPVIVVPLWKYEGLWSTTKAPAGAAVYTADGLEILSPAQLEAQSIEGPTYPRTVAELQRKGINGGGTLTDWWGSRYGYDLTDKDEEDANEGNTSEFTLIDGDAVMQYVSPLTPRGSSQSITAVSAVPAQQTSSTDGREAVAVNTNPDLGATSTVVTSIKESSVSGDNAWTTRWSAGMYVYEILPAQDGHWAASIGQGQAVSYRASISPEGAVTVTNTETGQSSGDKGAEGSITVDTGTPLSEMTEAELLETIAQATEELQARQNPSPEE